MQIYNATDGVTPEINPEYYEDTRILFAPGVVPGVPIFAFTGQVSGGLTFNPDVTMNATDLAVGIPEDQRVYTSLRELVVEDIVGTYTCRVENEFGFDEATTVVSFCGK